jgi:hypothetical protein
MGKPLDRFMQVCYDIPVKWTERKHRQGIFLSLKKRLDKEGNTCYTVVVQRGELSPPNPKRRVISSKIRMIEMAKVQNTVVEGVSAKDVEMLMDVLSEQFGTVVTPKGQKTVELVKVEVATGVFSIQSIGSVSSDVKSAMNLAKDLIVILRERMESEEQEA